MVEYLRGFNSELLNNWTLEKLFKNEVSIDLPTLILVLHEANTFLTETAGPNQERRRELAPSWLGWWISSLSSADQVKIAPGKIMTLDKLGEHVVQRSTEEFGVLFMGGGEGTRGHRYAVDWVGNYRNPILLFEQDGYLEKKARGGSFLPLTVRLSLWSYYNSNILLSAMPEITEGVDENKHYQQMFDRTHADYCFATSSDPNVIAKTQRGKYMGFNVIPDFDSASTTESVMKLMPDIPAFDEETEEETELERIIQKILNHPR